MELSILRKAIPSILITLLLGFTSLAQERDELTLAEAYTLLEENYPILQDRAVLQQMLNTNLEQLDIARLPSLQWKTDGRFQTESTQLDAEGAMLPFEINQPLVSVRSYVEANYLALDGGVNEAQEQLQRLQTAVEQQRLEVERYHLQERINQLFLRITLIRAQEDLLDISLSDLVARKESLAAGVEFGTVLESELTKIEVRQLELKARQDQLNYQLSGTIETLELLTGVELSAQVRLQFPVLNDPLIIPEIDRPEQELFQIQRAAILAKSDLIETELRPKLNLFAQAGVGYPNPLNILDNNVAPYGVLGAGLNWKITDWKKTDNEKQLLSLEVQRLNHAEQTFDFNLNSKEAGYRSDMERLQLQMQNDEAIANLQADILQQLAIQLDEGIITTTDYLIQSNAELVARQNKVIHEVELLQVQLQFWNERGQLKN